MRSPLRRSLLAVDVGRGLHGGAGADVGRQMRLLRLELAGRARADQESRHTTVHHAELLRHRNSPKIRIVILPSDRSVGTAQLYQSG